MRNFFKSSLLVISFFSYGAWAETQVPNTFVSGAEALASEVNENFTALATAIDGLATRIDKIEGTGLEIADVAGNYSWTGLQVGLSGSDVETINFTGSLALSTDGTLTANLSGRTAGGNPELEIGDTSAALSGTWVLLDTTVTLEISNVGSISFNGVSGNKILVGIANNQNDGERSDKHLIILTKDN